MKDAIKATNVSGINTSGERCDYVPIRPNEEAGFCLRCPHKKCRGTCKELEQFLIDIDTKYNTVT